MPQTPISRRRFLQTGSLLAAFPLAGHPFSRTRSAPDAKSVIIIGAGMAGLSAARLLKAQGYAVKILEGRDRIGGRIWTDRSWGDATLDLGASWIHGITGNPVYKIATQAAITVLPTNYDNRVRYAPSAMLLDEAANTQIEQIYDDALTALRKVRDNRQAANQADESIQIALDEYVTQNAITGQPLINLNYSVNTELEHEYAADSSDLSLFNFESDSAFGGGDVLFPGGYRQVVDYLAAGLDISTSQTVQSIAYQADGVTITTDKGSFQAASAIVTLPLGVLKTGNVQFNPPLPDTKRQAIQRLGMNVLNKAYLRFPAVFWPSDTDLIGFVSAPKGHWAEWLNFYKVTKLPILLGFNAGAYGSAIESLSDDQIVTEAMQALRQMFGSAIPDPEKWLITRHGADPFSMGSYSHYPPNAGPDDNKTLAEPVANRLYFAGEATSDMYPSTVHGALLSGERAANELIAANS